MANIDKVKILIIGDSGVGKSSLVHLIAYGQPITHPSATIGCSIEIKLHDYKEGSSLQKTYAIELWDIGGRKGHKKARAIFYQSAHGAIMVYDLANRKSLINLQKWLAEINNDNVKASVDQYDSEQVIGLELPLLIIGNKLDISQRLNMQSQSRTLASELGAEEIYLSSHNPKSLSPGSSSAVQLSRFFDKVIEKKFQPENIGGYVSNIKGRKSSLGMKKILIE